MGAASCVVHAAAALLRWVLFGITLTAAGFYFRQRALHTLEVEWYGYGVSVLVVEILSSFGALLSAVALIASTRHNENDSNKEDSNRSGRTLRVLVYSSDASLEKLQGTVEALLKAPAPPTCHKALYVLDDSGDYEKKHWVEKQIDNDGTAVEYVSRDVGRHEFNVRARSFNHVLAGLYGLRYKANIPEGDDETEDVVFVVDAGQICHDTFFKTKLAVLEHSSLVLSPQGLPSDSFVSNFLARRLRTTGVGSALGNIPTTSLRMNLAVRLDVLKRVELFDKTVLAEDYALVSEMAKRGEKFVYLEEPLAKSERAPGIARLIADRSNWALSTVLVLLGRRNPLSGSAFPVVEKFVYLAATLSQLVFMVLVPVFIVVPVLAIWLGVMPAMLNEEFLKGFIVYYPLLAVTMYAPWHPSSGMQIWLSNMADQLFWIAFFRGLFQAAMRKMYCHDDFTATVDSVVDAIQKCNADENALNASNAPGTEGTEKPYLISIVEKEPTNGGGPSSSSEITGATSGASFTEEARSEESIFSPGDSTPTKRPVKKPRVVVELVITALTLVISLGTLVAGLLLLARNPEPNSKSVVILSITMCIYNAVPPVVLLYYTLFKTRLMKGMVVLAALVSIAALGAAIAGMWFRHFEEWDYESALSKSFLFYEAQRSGPLPPDNRIPWRGSSGLLDRTVDGGSLVGGYYDGVDTMKHGFPMALATTILAWGLIEFPSGYGDQREHAEGAIRWATDYFLKAHTAKDELYVLVNGVSRSGRPRDVLQGRVRFGKRISPRAPGSDVAGATAAALASASVLFRESDPTYSEELLQHAKELYEFGVQAQGLYSDVINTPAYVSTSFKDDLAWAAAWLFVATNDEIYVNAVRGHMPEIKDTSHIFDYDRVDLAVCTLMAKITRHNDYKNCVESHIDKWKDDTPTTPARLTWEGETDPLPGVSNVAFLALVYHKHMQTEGVKKSKLGGYRCWAMFQLGYALGDSGRSFVVGWGHDAPTRPIHQGASCPDAPGVCPASSMRSPSANPQELTGALVAGPDEDDGFQDSRRNVEQSRVSLMNNAGFTSGVGALASNSDFSKCYHGLGFFEWLKVVDT